jgi:hypothetical protein
MPLLRCQAAQGDGATHEEHGRPGKTSLGLKRSISPPAMGAVMP